MLIAPHSVELRMLQAATSVLVFDRQLRLIVMHRDGEVIPAAARAGVPDAIYAAMVPGASAMPEPVDPIGARIRRVAGLGVWPALCCLGAGCEQMVSRQYSHDVGDCRGRIVSTSATNCDQTLNPASSKRLRSHELPTGQRIAKAAAFVQRYQDGWTTILSGSPGRQLAFREGDRVLTEIGVFDLGMTHDGKARTLTRAEVAELVGLLGVPWPPQDQSAEPTARDQARSRLVGC